MVNIRQKISRKRPKTSEKKSTLLKEFEHISLRVLNFYDICITKIDRGDARDFEDIKHVLEKTETKIPILIRKFILTMDHSESENPKFKLLEFVKFVKSLGYIIIKEDMMWTDPLKKDT
ncbi:hypothetical protein HZC31_04925 [Candidatus Woesearchaeota archaeon]|nr:hypothetical protein [Candidatus Woesearchaeota archaeon]